MKRLVFKTGWRYLKELSLFLLVYMLFLLLIGIMLSFADVSTEEVDALYGDYHYAPANIYQVYESIHPWGAEYVLVLLTPFFPVLLFFQDYFLMKLNTKELILLNLKGVNSKALYLGIASLLIAVASLLVYPLYILTCFVVNRYYNIGFDVVEPNMTIFIFIGVSFLLALIFNICLLSYYFSNKQVVKILRSND